MAKIKKTHQNFAKSVLRNEHSKLLPGRFHLNSNTNIYKVESRVQSRVQVPVLLLAYAPD